MPLVSSRSFTVAIFMSLILYEGTKEFLEGINVSFELSFLSSCMLTLVLGIGFYLTVYPMGPPGGQCEQQVDTKRSADTTSALRETCSVDDPGDPLVLTPLIEAGQVQRARTLSRVTGVPGLDGESYSGLLTVRPEQDANMFFWFFPAEVDVHVAPVVLWLNGGPGASSLNGLFAENGPYALTPNRGLQRRADSWTKLFSVIYIDSPVGTGYSYAKSPASYSNSSQEVGQDLYEAITQFFTLFSEVASNDFYVAGESYGAKYASWLSKIIHDMDAAAVRSNKHDGRNVENGAEVTKKIHFRGLITVSGAISATGLCGWADFLHQTGLLDTDQHARASSIEREFLDATESGNRQLAAHILWQYMLNGADSRVLEGSGLSSVQNILLTRDPLEMALLPEFVQEPHVRRAIHVGSLQFAQYRAEVKSALWLDILDDVTGVMEELLDAGHKVLMMSGNLDTFIPPVCHRGTAYSLQWKEAQSFRHSARVVWRVDQEDGDVAGYVIRTANLCLVLVRNAGHQMPADQGRSTLDAVRRFINDVPFD